MAFSGGTEISQVSIIYVQRLTKLLRVGNSVIFFLSTVHFHTFDIYMCVCVHTFKRL